MGNKTKGNPQLSKRHLLPAAFLISLAFTYAGVELPFFEVIRHFDFIINFIYNMLAAYLLLRLAHYLYFTKKLNLPLGLLFTLGAFFLWQCIDVFVFDYEGHDWTEFYSITLPFGSLVIIAFNLIYHLVATRSAENINGTGKMQNILWVDSVSGRVQFDRDDFRYAHLTPNALEINTEDQTIKTFYSLKQFEDLIDKKEVLFRLNKQYLCRPEAILSYRSLADGRLEITLPKSEKCFVSKNKASSFKKWLDETQA